MLAGSHYEELMAVKLFKCLRRELNSGSFPAVSRDPECPRHSLWVWKCQTRTEGDLENCLIRSVDRLHQICFIYKAIFSMHGIWLCLNTALDSTEVPEITCVLVCNRSAVMEVCVMWTVEKSGPKDEEGHLIKYSWAALTASNQTATFKLKENTDLS